MEFWHWTPNIDVTYAATSYWYARPGATDDFEPALRDSWQYVGLTERPEILKEMTPMRLVISE